MAEDGELQKDAENLYDFVGFDYNTNAGPTQVKPSKVVEMTDPAMSFASVTSSSNTVDDLLLQVVEQTLQVYSCSEKLAPLELIRCIDEDELAIFKEDVIVPMMKIHPQLVK